MTAPRVWLVHGDKAGDNAQVEVIAATLTERLGWPIERRRIELLPQWVKGKPEVYPRLDHLDLARSDALEPPWPDLVLTIGRRPSSVALWIRERSGGRTRIVLVGKPSSRIELYDLVVVSAENQLPRLPNVLTIGLPLMRLDEAAVEAAAEAWRERLAPLPRPLIAFLIGGPTGPYTYDRAVVDRLSVLAQAIVAKGGTPYLTTSRRTPADAADTLERRLPRAGRLFRWRPDAPDNPYRALLGLADGFVVTGDSISMMVEVARLGRPLQILPLSTTLLGTLDRVRRGLVRRLMASEAPAAVALADAGYRAGVVTQTRDFEAFHAMLLERGLACPLGGPFLPPTGRVADDLDRVVERIRGLVPA